MKSLLLMGTPVESKLKLNKQFSEELIIAYNFQWCFFYLKKKNTYQLARTFKNFTFNFNANTCIIYSGQSLQFLQEVRVIKYMRKSAKPWRLARHNGNSLEFYWDLISSWVDPLLNIVWKEKYPPEKKKVVRWCLSEIMALWNSMKLY